MTTISVKFLAICMFSIITLNFSFRRQFKTSARLRSLDRLFSQIEKKEPVEPDHQVPESNQAPSLTPEEQSIVERFNKHQQSAKKLSKAVQARTLIDQSYKFGVLSTNSAQYDGYPYAAVIGFAMDDDAKPFFSLTTMSSHTTDILKDGRSTLTVIEKDYKGATNGRVMLVGTVKKQFGEDNLKRLKKNFMATHKDAYWVDFGDFSYYKMEEIKTVRYIGGFANAGTISAEEFTKAQPDPISAFAEPIMKHMNDDHSDSTIAMVTHYTGVPCSEANIIAIDQLGMTVRAKLELAGGEYAKVRLPFPRPVTERKEVKDVLVEMTRESAKAKEA